MLEKIKLSLVRKLYAVKLSVVTTGVQKEKPSWMPDKFYCAILYRFVILKMARGATKFSGMTGQGITIDYTFI